VVLPVAARDAAVASGGVQDLGASAPGVAVPDAVAEPAGLPAAADVAAAGQEDVAPGDWPVLDEAAVREAGPGLPGGPAWVGSEGLTWAAPRDQALAGYPDWAAPGVAQPAVTDDWPVGLFWREHCPGGWRRLQVDCLQASAHADRVPGQAGPMHYYFAQQDGKWPAVHYVPRLRQAFPQDV
jgi:hypothetical protein